MCSERKIFLVTVMLVQRPIQLGKGVVTFITRHEIGVFEFFIEKNNIYFSVQEVVCCSHQSNRLGYVSRTNQIAALGYVSRTNQSVFFFLWFERRSNFNEVRGDSVRAVRKMESSFRMRMVDSCSREIGVLCTVARSWLLFLHDESEWKHFESNIG